MITFSHLSWDSDFFGYKVAKIELDHCQSETELAIFLHDLKEKGYKLIYGFVHPDDRVSNKAAGTLGQLVDEKVTYTTNIIDENIEDQKKINKYALAVPDLNLYRLSLESGEYSRFKKDKNIDGRFFIRLYQVWIEKSISGELADDVLIYEHNNEIVGLVTLSCKKQIARIGLIAVDEKYRGNSIGSQLVDACKKICINKRIQELDAVTQKDNSGACLFYEKCGFTVKKMENVYHFWQ